MLRRRISVSITTAAAVTATTHKRVSIPVVTTSTTMIEDVIGQIMRLRLRRGHWRPGPAGQMRPGTRVEGRKMTPRSGHHIGMLLKHLLLVSSILVIVSIGRHLVAAIRGRRQALLVVETHVGWITAWVLGCSHGSMLGIIVPMGHVTR